MAIKTTVRFFRKTGRHKLNYATIDRSTTRESVRRTAASFKSPRVEWGHHTKRQK